MSGTRKLAVSLRHGTALQSQGKTSSSVCFIRFLSGWVSVGLDFMRSGTHGSPCCERTARQRTCRSSGLGIRLCGQRTGIPILMKNLNIGVWLQAKWALISKLDPMDPIWGARWRNKKATQIA